MVSIFVGLLLSHFVNEVGDVIACEQKVVREITFFESVLCKSKYLRIRLSQYIPLKQGLRRAEAHLGKTFSFRHSIFH